MGTIRPVPGMVFEIAGRVRADRRHEHQIGETVEIQSIADLLERNTGRRYTLMQGESGTIASLEIVSLRILTHTEGNSRFPTTFVPIGD